MFQINQYKWNHNEGELHLPTPGTRVFASPANAYIGAQILPPMSEPSTIRLTRFDRDTALEYNRNLAINTRGQTVNIIDEHGVRYNQVPYLLRWFVADVRVVSAELIVHAHGHLGDLAFDYAPASKLVTEWVIFPIPAT